MIAQVYLAGLRPDVIAALTAWALLVPVAMAYAGIAGMPPETGLYAAPLALIGYATFGTSRHLNVGPNSTVAALSLSVVVAFAATGSDEFVALTILTGILLVIAGLLRLGVLADFPSRSVLDGLVVGVAITVVVGQLDKMLGHHDIRTIPHRHGESTTWLELFFDLVYVALLIELGDRLSHVLSLHRHLGRHHTQRISRQYLYPLYPDLRMHLLDLNCILFLRLLCIIHWRKQHFTNRHSARDKATESQRVTAVSSH